METEDRPKNWKRSFLTVWVGQAFSLFGSALVQFALIWYLTQETGSATVLATASLVGMLPQIVLGPFAGPWVDRLNRRRIIIVADSFIAFATLVLALLFYFQVVQVWHIYGLMFFRSLGGTFHHPAFSASTSLMVPKEHLARIQGVNQTLGNGLNILAAPLGALLLGLLPMQNILAIDLVTAFLAVLPLFFIPLPQPEKQLAENEKPSTFWQDFRAGLRYVFGWRGLLIILIMATAINFLFTPAGALSPLLITKHFNGGAVQLGWFEAVFGLGAILGGILLGIWGGFKRRVVTTLVGLVFLGVSMGSVGLVPGDRFPLALVAMAIGGLAVPITNGSLGAIFQTAVEPGMQGRVFTLVGSLATAMTPVSLAFAGPLADRFGVQTWYIAGGVTCALMGLLGFVLPSVMRIDEGRPTETVVKIAKTLSTK
ncbi:MAG: MFS transporter [Anaerolineales bacterium]